MNSIVSQLASSLGRRDEQANQELAQCIVANHNEQAMAELIALAQEKNKNIQNDCIKVIYEVAAQKPEMVVEHAAQLLEFLKAKNNRLQWGAMMALHYITEQIPTWIYMHLESIVAAADAGSVIANDHLVGILVVLCKVDEYASPAFTLLNQRLRCSPTNQLPMYAESALSVVHTQDKAILAQTLQSRLHEIDKVPKRKRIEKVLKKISS